VKSQVGEQNLRSHYDDLHLGPIPHSLHSQTQSLTDSGSEPREQWHAPPQQVTSYPSLLSASVDHRQKGRFSDDFKHLLFQTQHQLMKQFIDMDNSRLWK